MKYDVLVIGSGPGGYVAAIRCAQLGLKTAIVERYNVLGGTCLNVGCIPSKALLDSSEHFHNAEKNFETHGININAPKVDMAQMIKRKNEVVEQTNGGVSYLMNKNKIEVIHGHASFIGDNKVSVANGKEKKEIEFDKAIIATGSKPITPESFNYDKKRIITSTEALNIDKVPKKMVIIGAGVIGLELGSVYARLGTEIEVIEFQNRILPGMDKDTARDLQKSLKKLGMKFHLNHAVSTVTSTSRSVTVKYQKRDTEDILETKADYCLIAIGRRAYTDNLGLESIGVQTDDRGRIIVDNHLETSSKGIFAIGDVIKGAMLAHKAEDEGIFVAEYMANQKPHIDYNLIPGVVYTWPELSSVGKTEEQLKEEGVEYKVGKFPMKALGRSRASMDIEGLVKVISDASTDELLGVHMVGARAADLIMEAVALMEFRASAEDMARLCHPHPTYSEAVKEAALGATGNRYIHI
ncbi:MAG: dihydrolipoyl dehydrogenase [Saprospiraceae bacterium]|nr:dihydrolipoyl dehydrogenase [Saprospiraceae bacterium]